MNKVKNKVRRDFTIIPNALINDDNLTDRARFLFVYMASKPEDWDFYQVPLAKKLGYSIDTLRKYISELLESGWMERQERREGGKFDSFDYTLLPSPSGKNTDTVKTRIGKIPYRENSLLYNKDYNKERIDTKKESENAPANSDFFSPDKHETAAAEIIRYLDANPMYLNGMAKGDWKRAVKGHCLKLQKLGKWNELQIPANEGQYFSWIGARIAGAKSWFTTAAEFDRKSGRQPDAVTIKSIPTPQPVRPTVRASAAEARKIAGI